MPLPKIPKVKLAPPLSALSQAEREANLAKMLNESAIKDRMYHGTNQDITSFRPNLKSDATFLTPKPELANKFAMDDLLYDSNSTYRGARSGANVMPVYAQVKNPWDYENPAHIEAVAKILDPQDRKAFIKQAPTGNWMAIEDHFPSIQQAGFDAAHIMEGGVKNLGVFNQKAIKSATGNRGTYDVNDPDITKAAGGLVDSAPEEAIKNTITDPQAFRMLDMDLANLALMNQKMQRMAGGGAVRMDKGGKASKDDIMNLKPQPKAQDTSFASVRSLLADIGSNQEEYERIAQGGAFDRRKFTPENIYAIRLLQAANATPDPARYLESLNPYLDSQLQFDLSNPNSNVLGYVAKSEPNKVVVLNMKGVEDTIPHELTHTLQWGKGKNIDPERNRQTMWRAQELPIAAQKAMMPSGNRFENMKEVWANVAAKAHLVNAAGGDFINSPEAQRLFPTNTEQRDYYANAMPGVNSITPDTGTFVPNNQTLLQRAKKSLGFADGGITPRAFSYSPTDRDEHNRKLGLPAEFYRAGHADPTMQSYGAGVSVPVGGARLTADAIAARNAQMRDTLAGIMLGAEFPVGEGTLRAEMMRPTMQGASPTYGLRYNQRFAQGGQVQRFDEGGAVTDTLDKMVKSPQASNLLNLDLPNLNAARQQTRAMKRGGKVEFSHNIDDMRYALTRRQG